MIGVCKFCGCTEDHPCVIPDEIAEQHVSDFGAGMTSRGACAWLLEDVCTNPACVEAAYLEARPLAEELMQKLDMILEAA